GRRDPGVVEGDVHRAVGVVRGLEERLDLLGVGDVDPDEEPADLLGGGLARGLVDVGADDVRALGGEAAGGGQPDAAARAGDDGGAAGQAAADDCVGRGGHVAHSSVLMKTFLVSVKAASAPGPSSRPSPDWPKPPKGVQYRTALWELTERLPEATPRETRSARPTSRVHSEPASP